MSVLQGKWKHLITLLACILLASCSGSGSELNEGDSQGQTAEFLGGGSCSEQVIYNEEIGFPASVVMSEGYFECGHLESLVSSQPGSMPTGSGIMNLKDGAVSTDAAAVVFFYDNEYENHKGIQLYLHDGEIRQIDKRFEQSTDSGAVVYRHEIRWGIYTATYVLSVELGSVAADQFDVGTFEFANTENPSDPAYANINTMFRAVAFYDLNKNGLIDSLDEILDVDSGHVTITGERPNWSITVDMQLSNGDVMTGQYTGDYVDIPLAEEYEP